MLASLSWLQELLPGPALDPAALADTLTSLGVEVDSVTEVGAHLRDVVVGEVRARAPHPDADRLTLVEVFDGARVVPVVCGAPNVPAPGGKVALAPPGVCLPGGLRLVEREIRGQRSCGMLCAEDELDVGTDHEGILILPEDAEPGTPLAELLPGAHDHVLELSITPNRPDALGHVGLARDLAAKLGRELVLPGPGPLRDALGDTREDPDLVELAAPDRCGRYHGVAFDGARVGASPLWLRLRLHRLGLRAINAAVDVTNLVLMEWGQPLHVFDRGRLAGGRVHVRRARAGEAFCALDGQELTLTGDDLVIADDTQPQALAGVMGGARSGVEPGAERLLLEAAWFQPAGVRRAARRHGLHTDSSHRFERGVDWDAGLARAAARALALLVELTGARPVAWASRDGELPERPVIRFRPARARALLGMDVDAARAAGWLRALGLQVDDADPHTWSCVAPSHRPDLALEEDLIEEVMRMQGLEALPAVAAVPSAPPSVPLPSGPRALARRLSDALRDFGLLETISWVFQPEARLAWLDPFVPTERRVRVDNPLRAEDTVLRPHMLPGLLDAVALNLARHTRPVALFEVGRVYLWPNGGGASGRPDLLPEDASLPAEPWRLSFVLCPGRGRAAAPGADARRAVGLVVSALRSLGLRPRVMPPEPEPPPAWHPGVAARVVLPEVGCVAVVGEVHPDRLEQWDLPAGTRVYYGEVHIDRLPERVPCTARSLPRFPATTRDVSVELPAEVPARTVLGAVEQAAASLAGDDEVGVGEGDGGEPPVAVVEDYRGEGVPQGARALLLRLHYRAEDRSVRDDEVDALHERIVAAALDALRQALGGAAIRRR